MYAKALQAIPIIYQIVPIENYDEMVRQSKPSVVAKKNWQRLGTRFYVAMKKVEKNAQKSNDQTQNRKRNFTSTST